MGIILDSDIYRTIGLLMVGMLNFNWNIITHQSDFGYIWWKFWSRAIRYIRGLLYSANDRMTGRARRKSSVVSVLATSWRYQYKLCPPDMGSFSTWTTEAFTTTIRKFFAIFDHSQYFHFLKNFGLSLTIFNDRLQYAREWFTTLVRNSNKIDYGWLNRVRSSPSIFDPPSNAGGSQARTTASWATSLTSRRPFGGDGVSVHKKE